jgi:hypothetical protein
MWETLPRDLERDLVTGAIGGVVDALELVVDEVAV